MVRCKLCGREGEVVNFIKKGIEGYVVLRICERCLRILMGEPF